MRGECNMIVQCDLPIEAFQFFQRVVSLPGYRIPPVVEWIECGDLLVARHGIQKKAVAARTGIQREAFRCTFKEPVSGGESGLCHPIPANRTAHGRANFKSNRKLELPGLKEPFFTASIVALFRSCNCEFVTATVFTFPSGPMSTWSEIVPVDPLRLSASG